MTRWFMLASLGLLASLAADTSAQPRALHLTMRRAVELALSTEGNPRVRLSDELVKQTESRAAEARAALLPTFDASVVDQREVRNLAALGLPSDLAIGAYRVPKAVGPFNVFDGRLAATQSIFDFSSIRRLQAARVAISAARADGTSLQDEVAVQVAKAYLAALRARASVDAVKANLLLAEAVLKQAETATRAGATTGIEVTRAKVQLSNEAQRLLSAQSDQRRAHLQLLRAIGLSLDTDVELTDSLTYLPVKDVTVEGALAKAWSRRADLIAQRDRERNLWYSNSALTAERLPVLSTFADYGSTGTGLGSALETRTIGFSLRVPIFDGGRREARRAEIDSKLREERIRTTDLKQQVELEIRLALESLASAEQQVEVAREAVALADEEIVQARKRHSAGVTSSLEVTDAQTRLARARDNEIAALFTYNEARLDLGQAMGTVRDFIQ